MIANQRRVSAELGKTTKELDSFRARLTPVAAGVAILAAALMTLKAAKLADEFRLLSSRVEIATGSVEAGSVAFGALVAISQRTSTSLSANITLFTRLNSSMQAMGGTQEDTLRLTELVAKAMRVSGASVQETASTMRQFGQAMGKGQLNGDELTSLMENSEYLARKLAQGLGVPVGALKDLGEQGKLTSDAIV
ncbi:tape measure protein, partial [Ramlibacter sp.]|uniref:tape measure protein n=1 Tax=Ramlibacter sp. TaxID=1917967 RepID=UPI00262EF9BA